MTTVQAILLGIVQGLTEFFPVSSSGHLKLAERWLGLENLEQYIAFDLACHLGTLCSIFVIFGRDIINMLFKNRERMNQVILGTLPLFPLLLIMKPIKGLFDRPEFLGYFFIITAALIWLGMRFEPKPSKSKWKDALIIGSFQALAILPGISRSGSTISGARLLGWTPGEALSFSFLLAIPAILGGSVIELSKLVSLSPSELPSVPLAQYLVGFITSFIVGTASLHILKSLVRNHSFMYFAWYCLLLGLFCLYLF